MLYCNILSLLTKPNHVLKSTNEFFTLSKPSSCAQSSLKAKILHFLSLWPTNSEIIMFSTKHRDTSPNLFYCWLENTWFSWAYPQIKIFCHFFSKRGCFFLKELATFVNLKCTNYCIFWDHRLSTWNTPQVDKSHANPLILRSLCIWGLQTSFL